MMPYAVNPSAPPAVSPYRAAGVVTEDGRALPLLETQLRVRAGAGLAHVVLRQTFRNPFRAPLAVRYQVPLPPDGAVGGFSFDIDGVRIEGDVRGRAEARADYEAALVEGRTAALLEQDRSSLFNQEVGNIPPGATLVAELRVDHPLTWSTDGRWQWRFPTVVASRYLGAAGRVADADRVAPAVARDGATTPRIELELTVTDPLYGEPTSSAHPIVVHPSGPVTRVALADRDAAMDRDFAVEWTVPAETATARLRTHRPERPELAGDAYGLLTLTPPWQPTPSVPRDLILLLDVSGSMDGAPLRQLQRVSSALVESLGPDDTLSMIAFAMRPSSFKRKPARVTPRLKRKAQAWIHRLQAGGGTEMRRGIIEALTPLRHDGQRQVVLMTDGLIGFEDQVVGTILDRLAAGSRVHCLGVGSAVNRSLTQSAARAGRGVEVIVGVDEAPEPAARRLVAATAAPLVVDLYLTGTALRASAPSRMPDLFAGAPACLSVRLAPEGGTLEVHGQTPTGPFRQSLVVPPVAPSRDGEEIRRRFAREWVADHELRRVRGERVDAEVEAWGLRHRIATRLTSWVAISPEALVDPTAPSRKQVIPQAVPHGMSPLALGVRPPAPASPPAYRAAHLMSAIPGPGGPPPTVTRAGALPPPPGGVPSPDFAEDGFSGGAPPPASPPMGPPPGSAPPAPRRRGRRAAPPASKKGASAPYEGGADGGGVPHGPNPATLHGRVVLARGGRLVVEVVVPFALPWAPDVSVGLETDAATFAALLEREHSTEGTLEAGQVIRITLSHAASGPPHRLHVTSGGRNWVIELS
ncbi:MAG: VIT and VWA domain-containing protein [Myxococcota bacterium]